MLANQVQNMFSLRFLSLRTSVRHCLNEFKSRFKNSQAAERRIQNLQGLIN